MTELSELQNDNYEEVEERGMVEPINDFVTKSMELAGMFHFGSVSI